MVEAFVGLVGGGKSYNSVRRMCNYIGNGGAVVTNILFTGWDVDRKDFTEDAPLFDYLRKQYHWQDQQGQYQYISFDEMCTMPGWFKRVPGGSDRLHRTFLCIDEATDLFDTLDRSKLSNDSVYRELFRFLRLSRHAHIDVLFVCQDINAINSRLRGLVSFIWRSTDLANFRVGGLKIALPVNCFLLQQFERTGKMEVRREFVAKEPDIFKLYESEAFHDKLGITFATRVRNGRIEGKDEMTPIQKIMLAGSLLLSVFSLYRQYQAQVDVAKRLDRFRDEVPVNVSDSSPAPEIQEDARPSRSIVRGVFNFVQTPRQSYCYIDGCLFRPGLLTEYGVCKIVSKDAVICVDGLHETVIVPCNAIAAVGASAVSLQGVPGGGAL